jgi:hypothetical protein
MWRNEEKKGEAMNGIVVNYIIYLCVGLLICALLKGYLYLLSALSNLRLTLATEKFVKFLGDNNSVEGPFAFEEEDQFFRIISKGDLAYYFVMKGGPHRGDIWLAESWDKPSPGVIGNVFKGMWQEFAYGKLSPINNYWKKEKQ